MLLQNLSMQRLKLLEQHLEVLEILNSSYSDYLKYMLKIILPNFSAWSDILLPKLISIKKQNPLNSSFRGFFLFLSGWQDSNLRPPAPKAGAIPGYATSRTLVSPFLILLKSGLNFCRDGRIRTYDLLLPKQARYRATLHPELGISFFISLFLRAAK